MQVACGSTTEKGKWCEDEHDLIVQSQSIARLKRTNPLKEGGILKT